MDALKPMTISYVCDPEHKNSVETIMVKTCYCKAAGSQIVCMAELPDDRTLALVLAPGMRVVYYDKDTTART